MNDSVRPAGRFGLCDTCVNAKLVRNTRGSAFLMCKLHQADDRFAKYPPTPVLQCPGHKQPSDQ